MQHAPMLTVTNLQVGPSSPRVPSSLRTRPTHILVTSPLQPTGGGGLVDGQSVCGADWNACKVRLADTTVGHMFHTSNVGACVVKIPHEEVHCRAPPGTGKDFRFLVTVGGVQSSVIPGDLGYHEPVIVQVKPLYNTDAEGNVRRTATTSGRELIELRGLCFGENFDFRPHQSASWRLLPGTRGVQTRFEPLHVQGERAGWSTLPLTVA